MKAWTGSFAVAALLSLTLLLPGCEEACGPENCNGCCDAENTCQAGVAVNACGAEGAACLSCPGTLTCQQGLCSGGGGGSGGGGTPVVCNEGARDLAAGTKPAGLSIVSLGSLAANQPTTFFGEAGWETATVGVCVPNDAVSIALLSGDAFPSSWRANDVELIDTSSVDQLIRWITPDFQLPKGPEVGLQPGHHEFKLVTQTSTSLSPVLAIRRGARRSQGAFKANIIFAAGTGITEQEVTELQTTSAPFDSLYGRAGVLLTDARGGSIDNPDYAVVTAGNYGPLTQAPVRAAGEPLFTDALNLYFVREIVSNDAAGSLLGQSLGIPGAPGVPLKGGVVISLDAHRRGGDLDGSAIWVTIAHELAHWHGLRHTTERTGRTFDLVADTPECAEGRDADGNGLLTSNECSGSGAENFMFWTYDFTAPPTEITAGQSNALSSALTVEPR